jgi:anti-sigma B factor antagonist
MAVTLLPSSPCFEPDGLSTSATVSIRNDGSQTIVAILGEADLSNRPVLADALAGVIARDAGDVVIDLTGTEFVDTAIIRALVDGQQILARRGRQLTFRTPSRPAARLLDLFGLTGLIETADGPPNRTNQSS